MHCLTHTALSVSGGFVNTFPALKPVHRKKQCGFFGAASKAGLPTGPAFRQARIDGINAFLGLSLSSTTQLSPEAHEALSAAIEAGAFTKEWKLTGRVRAVVDVMLVSGDPLCSCCNERPVHYLFASEDGFFDEREEEGHCRECMTVQELDEEEVTALLVAESEAEFEHLRVAEDAHEDALSELQLRADTLRARMRTTLATLNDTSAFHSRHNRRVLTEVYHAAKSKLNKLQDEYPFI